jgi:hypothetical protein
VSPATRRGVASFRRLMTCLLVIGRRGVDGSVPTECRCAVVQVVLLSRPAARAASSSRSPPMKTAGAWVVPRRSAGSAIRGHGSGSGALGQGQARGPRRGPRDAGTAAGPMRSREHHGWTAWVRPLAACSPYRSATFRMGRTHGHKHEHRGAPQRREKAMAAGRASSSACRRPVRQEGAPSRCRTTLRRRVGDASTS